MSANTTITNPPAKKRFLSLRFKLLILFTLLFSVIFAGTYYWFYTFVSDVAETQIREDLTGTLLAAASGIDGDKFEAFTAEAEPLDSGYTDDIRYWQHVTWLNRVHKLERRAFVYTYQVSPDQKEVYFVGSMGAVWNPPQGATFLEEGSFRTDQGSPKLRGLSQTTFSDKIYTDDFGTWISGYTAVRNSAGEVVGGLGVDFQATYVNEVQDNIIASLGIAFGITYFIVLLTVTWLASTLTQPIVSLRRIAEKVGEGYYKQNFDSVFSPRVRDEIDILAQVFATMVSKVNTREKQLKDRVRSLTIQIDEKKKDEQVKEIVDSDFFNELQSKANEMRQRHARRRPKTYPQQPKKQEP